MRERVFFGENGSSAMAGGLVFIHLLLSPLLFRTDTLESFEQNKVALLLFSAVLLAALGIMRSASSWRIVRVSWRDPIQLGVVLMLVSAVVSTFLSISPHTSLRGADQSYAGLGTVAAYAVLFFATRQICPTAMDARRLLVAPVLAAAFASAYALVQAAGVDPLSWGGVSRIGGHERPFATMGHANLLAAYLVMAVPLTAYFARRAFQQRSWLHATDLVVIALLSIVAIVATFSRGAWLALAGVALFLVATRSWQIKRRRVIGAVLRSLLLFAGAGFAAWCLPGGRGVLEALSDRAAQVVDAGPRKELWIAGWQIFCEHSLTGCGLDTFPLAFTAKRTPAFWHDEWNVLPFKAHNEVIHILATQGVLGLFALLLFTGGLFWMGRAAWRNAVPEERPLVRALVAATVGFIIHAMFNFTVAGCGTLLVTFAALLSRMGTPETGPAPLLFFPTSRWSYLGRIAVGVAACALIWWGVLCPLQASRMAHDAELALNENPVRAAQGFREAIAFDAGNDLYWSRLGTSLFLQARQSTAPAEQRRLLAESRQALEHALALVPAAAHHHANLARGLAEQARLGDAQLPDVFTAFEAALALDGKNPYYFADASKSALVLGDPARAREYAVRGLELFPDLGPLRAQIGFLALLDKRPNAADLLARAHSGKWHGDLDSQLYLESVLIATYATAQRFLEARPFAEELVRLRPESVPAHLSLAGTLEGLRRNPQAVSEYRWVLRHQPENAIARAALLRLK